jgi:pimeloyl-ACP methyl ester carboxylesterase
MFPEPDRCREVSVSGNRIHFIRKGRGKSLILIHGILSSSFVWRRNLDYLSKHFDVVALDVVGHGHSDKPDDGGYSREAIRRFMKGFMDALDIDQAYLAGHSWGGGIAMDMALAHPGRVEKLVLLDSTGYSGGTLLAEWLLMRNVFLSPALNLLGRPLVRAALRKAVFHETSLVTDSEVEGWLRDARAGARSLLRLRNYNLVMEGGIPSISQPTLVLWGREDRLMPRELAERFRRDIGRCTLNILDQCGHNPQEERPVEVNEAICRFLMDDFE